MPRILLVPTSYHPALPADCHRVRFLAHYLSESGWHAEILAPGREFQNAEWLDPGADSFFNLDVPIHESRPAGTAWYKSLGMKSLSWRALLPTYRLGCRLLRSGKFDLVYISTAKFNFFCLGRLWARRFGIPYVLDFHDPWYRPGKAISGLKAGFAQRLSRVMERFAVTKAAGIVAVSPHYIEQLRTRYSRAPVFLRNRTAVIPFGVRAEDYQSSHRFSACSASPVVAYVGVGGSIMLKSFRRIVQGILRLRERNPALISGTRFELIGTDGNWRPGKNKILLNEAIAGGLSDLVNENPATVPFSESAKIAANANGLLVLGVDDPAYMPSKLFPYALTGKPLLACMHWKSQANEYFQRMPELGNLIHFDAPPEVELQEDEIILRFLREVQSRATIDRSASLEPYTARAMTRAHVSFFDTCCRSQ